MRLLNRGASEIYTYVLLIELVSEDQRVLAERFGAGDFSDLSMNLR